MIAIYFNHFTPLCLLLFCSENKAVFIQYSNYSDMLIPFKEHILLLYEIWIDS